MKRWLVLLALLAACSGGDGAAPTTTVDPNVAPQSAIDSCHRAVESQLTSPGSAQYDAGAPPQQEPQGPSWHIRGNVDSQNGFGALVRSNYDCVVDPGSLTHDAQEWLTRAYVTAR